MTFDMKAQTREQKKAATRISFKQVIRLLYCSAIPFSELERNTEKNKKKKKNGFEMVCVVDSAPMNGCKGKILVNGCR